MTWRGSLVKWGRHLACRQAGRQDACPTGDRSNIVMGTSTLDLVLINPSSRRQVYQSLGSELAAVENPVWAGLMATFCRLKGLAIEIIDAEAEELGPDDVAERVEYLRPVLAAIVVYGHQPSASTQIM